jgi:hypothetical protein
MEFHARHDGFYGAQSTRAFATALDPSLVRTGR